MAPRRFADDPRPRRRLGSSDIGNGSLGAIVLATLALCLLPSSAAARHVIAPPGNAGVEQYVEVVPGAEGNEPVDAHSGKGDAISQSTQRHLEALGPEGKADASFAKATGSSKGRRDEGKGHSGKHAAGGGRTAKGGDSGTTGTPNAGQPAQTAAGGGIGIGLPLALALIALLALGGGLLRRRLLS